LRGNVLKRNRGVRKKNNKLPERKEESVAPLFKKKGGGKGKGFQS